MKVNPLVEAICVFADSTKTFCVALVVPDEAKLQELAVKLEVPSCKRSREDLCKNVEVVIAAHYVLVDHAKKNLEKFEIPRRYALVAEQWTPDGGLVTAALKLKRKTIQNRYQATINRLYAYSGTATGSTSTTPGPTPSCSKSKFN